MAFFWGTVFTLTLTAIYAPAAIMIRRRLGEMAETEETDPGFEAWASDLQFLKLRRQLGAVLAVLGPLLVGPAGALLQALSNIGHA